MQKLLITFVIQLNIMTDVTLEDIKVNNEIYETLMEAGTEVLNNPNSFKPGIRPIDYLNECIQFFSELDTVEGYNKCADLRNMRDKFIKEGK